GAQLDAHRAAAALPRARAEPPRRRQSVCAVDGGRRRATVGRAGGPRRLGVGGTGMSGGRVKGGITDRGDLPRMVLAGGRLGNGTSALLVPKVLMKRLGVDAQASPAVVYGLRMFGIRTVLIGLDLISADADVRARAVRVAPLVHGADTLSAAFAGIRGDLPRRA